MEIFQNPVDLRINDHYQVNSMVYVNVTVKNHKVPFLPVSIDKFSLTNDEQNTTAKPQRFTMRPGIKIMSSKEVAEDGETTGWLVFDMGDRSNEHTLKFDYGLFSPDATVKF